MFWWWVANTKLGVIHELNHNHSAFISVRPATQYPASNLSWRIQIHQLLCLYWIPITVALRSRVLIACIWKILSVRSWSCHGDYEKVFRASCLHALSLNIEIITPYLLTWSLLALLVIYFLSLVTGCWFCSWQFRLYNFIDTAGTTCSTAHVLGCSNVNGQQWSHIM